MKIILRDEKTNRKIAEFGSAAEFERYVQDRVAREREQKEQIAIRYDARLAKLQALTAKDSGATTAERRTATRLIRKLTNAGGIANG